MTQTAEILKTPTSAAPESIEKCAELAQLVERFVDTKGEYDERIPGLHMSSLKAPISTPNCFYVLSVGMILKGSKQLLIGGKRMTTKPVPCLSPLLICRHRMKSEPFPKTILLSRFL